MIKFKIKRMDWDSSFWGINIYSINKDYDLKTCKLYIYNELNNKSFIIQALASENDIKYINELESSGFHFVETKINLVKKVKKKININLSNIFKDVRYEDLEKYKNEFYSLYGEVSRFSCFDKEKINEFYYQ